MLDADMTGKTVLITGATGGIGFETAAGLLRLGAHVVMVSRDVGRGALAQQRLVGQTGSQRVDVLAGDLASQESIRGLETSFLERYPRLDVLINNAGVIEPSRRVSSDGIEMTFAVNVVAPFLLTNLLLDRLKESMPSRIVMVSSAAQDKGTLDLDDLQFERRTYSMLRAYGQSKVALNVLTAELARRLPGSFVTVNAVHPGRVATNMGNRGRFIGAGWKVAKRFMLSAAQGAESVIHLAASPEVTGWSGGYLVRDRKVRPNPVVESPEVGRHLWAILERLTFYTSSTQSPWPHHAPNAAPQV
jgi:NAD(P)-dependent dehydrogenase (short-subunit alcohol dehydrogenase family)